MCDASATVATVECDRKTEKDKKIMTFQCINTPLNTIQLKTQLNTHKYSTLLTYLFFFFRL